MNWLMESVIMNDNHSLIRKEPIIEDDIIYDLNKSYYSMLTEANKEYYDFYKDMILKMKNSSIDVLSTIKFMVNKRRSIMSKYISSWIYYIFTDVFKNTINRLYNPEQKLAVIKKIVSKKSEVNDLVITCDSDIYYYFGYPNLDRIREKVLDSKDVLRTKTWGKTIEKGDLLKNIDKNFLDHKNKPILYKTAKIVIANRQYTVKELLDRIENYRKVTKTRSEFIFKYIQNTIKELSSLKNDIKDTYKNAVDIKGIDKDLCNKSMINIISDYNALFESFCIYWKDYNQEVFTNTKLLSDIIDDITDEIQDKYIDIKNQESKSKVLRKKTKSLPKKNILKESKLSSEERTDFGLPELKKYPMPDKEHVLAAIRMFNHVDEQYEEELARNIIKKMKEYNISFDTVGDKNRLKKYIPK